MIRIAKMSIEDVFNMVGSGDVELHNVKVNMDSIRYKVFKEKGIKCVSCGLEGSYFILEAHSNDAKRDKFHFNLYATNTNGTEVLMTKDHIFPVSYGGSNELKNLQPMCANCNRQKSDQIKSDINKDDVCDLERFKKKLLITINVSVPIIGVEVCKKNGKPFSNGKVFAKVLKLRRKINKDKISNMLTLEGVDEEVCHDILTYSSLWEKVYSLNTFDELKELRKSLKPGNYVVAQETENENIYKYNINSHRKKMIGRLKVDTNLIGKKVCKRSFRPFGNRQKEAIIVSFGKEVLGNKERDVAYLEDVEHPIDIRLLTLADLCKKVYSFKRTEDLVNFEKQLKEDENVRSQYYI